MRPTLVAHMKEIVALDDICYHGSKHSSLQSLDISFSSERHPFSPAVYLTKDKVVAGCYAQKDGVIYCVRIFGDSKFIINLDGQVTDQSEEAIDAIRRLSKIHYRKTDIFHRNARDVIHPYNACRAMANAFLRNRGIWMIYGHLSGIEICAPMDRGIQYAVINNKHIRIENTSLKSE